MTRPLTDAEREVLLALRDEVGLAAINAALKQPSKAGRKRQPSANNVGVWAAIEVRRGIYGDQSTAKLHKDMQRVYGPKVTLKTLQNRHAEAVKSMKSDDGVRQAALSMIQVMKRDTAANPELCFLPTISVPNQQGSGLVTLSLDTHAIDLRVLPRFHGFTVGPCPGVYAVSVKLK